MLNDWDLAIHMDACQTDRRQLARTVSVQIASVPSLLTQPSGHLALHVHKTVKLPQQAQ